MLVKKYGNRRLYDTEASRYVTLEELAEKIRAGADARVVDAKTNADLTQATLTQIILESRGAGRLLPVPLLLQLIRLGDDALVEFFGLYVQWALEVYLQTRQVAFGPLHPLAALARHLPGLANPFARKTGGASAAPPAPPDVGDVRDEIAALRAQLEALERRSAPRARPRRG